MRTVARSLLAVLLLASPGIALAQDPDAKTDKQKAKEQRIEEYLRKKEQRRAEAEADARRAESAQQKASVDAASGTAAGAGAGAAAAAAPGSGLPRDLARAQQAVRASSIGEDPTIQRYLDLIDRQEASPHQLAAFGNFLSDSGMPNEALVYYDVALSLEKNDEILWLNAGTLFRHIGDLSAAANAYGRVLIINPNNADAHYNLATVFDQQRKYEDAIEAYKLALMLDPSLGDPTVNPQAANNSRLLAVKLLLYQQQTGNLSLPLAEVPGGQLPDEPQKDPDDSP